MKVRLLIRNKIDGEAGEIVEVSPAEFDFLTSVGSARPVVEAAPAKKRTTTKKG